LVRYALLCALWRATHCLWQKTNQKPAKAGQKMKSTIDLGCDATPLAPEGCGRQRVLPASQKAAVPRALLILDPAKGYGSHPLLFRSYSQPVFPRKFI
jgi:hypothetical protein